MPHSMPPFSTPDWLSQSRLMPLPAPQILDWLFDEGSLTRRLTHLSDDSFSITPLLEGWQTLRDDECAALDLPPASQGWVRETYLRGRGQAWVFARSVAARSALEHGGLNLDELGSRSLGELLFCDQAFARRPIEVCHYPRHWLPAAVQADDLWARRSRFDRGTLSVLVAEIFLPTLWSAASVPPENR
ncbi:chorismate--pyruvate lyase family protein [Pseudomonas chlororaphis]|uniref:Probable chorismate pyruvate-lyase n=1 Tax=Pseudomonas chlororaphis TaxID=587753 RepID=A0A1Q8EH03_9PSED|nr:chorismate lyase [Pseudomonas chlororaphis]OLF51083.1 chorismate--pyruvate lyase [Pseudomonas chlororaphis]